MYLFFCGPTVVFTRLRCRCALERNAHYTSLRLQDARIRTALGDLYFTDVTDYMALRTNELGDLSDRETRIYLV